MNTGAREILLATLEKVGITLYGELQYVCPEDGWGRQTG
jgi:hypothetical protein